MTPISYVRAADGTLLAHYEWRAGPGVAPPLPGPGEPGIYLLHGLGEHAGRYDALARRLSALGWHVGAHDHRGHGCSGGERALLHARDDLVIDAAERLRAWTDRHGRPPVLLGHSLGALVAAHVALYRHAELAGLVLASPPFKMRIPSWSLPPLTWLVTHYPDVRVRHNRLVNRLSHDPEVMRALGRDPLAHRYLSQAGWPPFSSKAGARPCAMRRGSAAPPCCWPRATTASSTPRAAGSSPGVRLRACSPCAGTIAPGTNSSTNLPNSPSPSIPT